MNLSTRCCEVDARLAILAILTDPNPVLRRKAQSVRKINANIRQLLDDMAETMYAAPGSGLAAPQVGISKRVICVDAGRDYGGLYQMINPEITRHGSELLRAPEACLSVPGVMGDVERWAEIEVRGLDRQGRPVFVAARGWLARVFQHEIDHLDGVLYTDKCTNLRDIVRPEPQAAAAPESAPVEVMPE